MSADETGPFGALLRRLRLAAGLSQEALAERAHLSVDAIGALERGRRVMPHPETLARLAEAMHLSPPERARLMAAVSRPSAPGGEAVQRAARSSQSPGAPPPTHASPIRHNLPVPLSSFVGRERELARLGSVLAAPSPSARLLTLVGPGGIGKTRLALQLARSLVADLLRLAGDPRADAYADGVWLVDLSSLDDPSLVPAAVAAVLGVREPPGQSVAATLATILVDRRLLVVLDNCEHLIGACAQLADRLLGSCPGLRILATSREALGIPGEVVWPVSPLSCPSGVEDGPRIRASDGGQGDEAIRLFVDRASTAQPDFAPTADNAPVIAEICRQLDGIPLAIELAAARVNALGVQTIAERLSDRFRLLTGGNRAAEPRHQTLQALVEWSYDLLAPEERRLFARLSAFAGGWDLEAAEAVCSGGSGAGGWGLGDSSPLASLQCVSWEVSEGEGQPFPTPNPWPLAPTEVLDLLGRLVSKSLVIPVPARSGRTRYRMLETLRHFALQRLEASGEVGAIRARHARYYLDFMEWMEPLIEGPEQVARLDQLEENLDNLRAALDWCVAADAAAAGFRASWTLSTLAWLRSSLNEADARLTALLALPSTQAAPPRLRAKALVSAGHVAFWRGELTRARRLLAESLAILRDLDAPADLGRALIYSGMVARGGGEYELARAQLAEAVDIFRELRDEFWLARAATNLGRCLNFLGDRAGATTYLDDALTLRRALGDARGVANTLLHLAEVAEARGDPTGTRALLAEGLATADSIRDRFLVLQARAGLGRLAFAAGDAAEARHHLEAAFALAQQGGFGHEIVLVPVLLALIARDEGNLAQARGRTEYSLRRARQTGQRREAAQALYLLGDLARQEGRPADARVAFRESLALYRQLSSQLGIALSLAALAGLPQPPEQAGRLAGAADAIRARHDGTNASIEWRELGLALDRARGLQDHRAGARGWAEGRCRPLDEVIAAALADEGL